MPKTKYPYSAHLSSFARKLKLEPDANESRSEATLDCPETLEQFEEAILELFSPAPEKNTKLH